MKNEALAGLLQLNLGCGQNHKAGHINVDKFGDPDVKHDLEVFPWPFDANSVGHVLLSHVLEHLGRDPEVFCGIMKELHRVCADGALVRIAVPHPRHDDFLNDPTHVRVITPEVLGLFSMANCLHWKEKRAANSPLAMYHGVDFELVENRAIVAEPHWSEYKEGTITSVELDRRVREQNNVVKELRMVLRVIKPVRTSEAGGSAVAA